MKKIKIDFKSKKFIISASITAGVLVIAIVVGIVLGVNASNKDILGYMTSESTEIGTQEVNANTDNMTIGQATNMETGKLFNFMQLKII